MAWIPNVNPNELVASSWGNTIRDHVVNTFTNVAARNSAIPAPVAGMTCYLSTLNVFEVYNGAVWVNVPGLNVPVLGNLTASSGAVSGAALAIPGLSAGVNVSAAAHQIKLTAALLVAQTGGPSLIRLQILDGAAQVAGTFQSVAANGFEAIMFGAVVTAAVGAHTYQVTMSTDVGTATVNASGIAPSWLLAEDMGA